MQSATANSVVPESPSVRERIGLNLLSFLHYFVLGTWLPLLPLYCQQTLGFHWNQTAVICSCVFAGLVAAPFVHALAGRLRMDQRTGLATCHLFAAAITMTVGWKRQIADPSPVNLLLAMLVVGAFSISISPCHRWLFEFAQRQIVPDAKGNLVRSRSWRLWGAVGFVAPAWITEFILMRFNPLTSLVASRDILWLLAGWGSVLATLSTFLLSRSTSSEANKEKVTKHLGLGFSLAFLLTLTCFRSQNFWMPSFIDRVLFSHQIRVPFEHRLIVVSQVFEVFGLFVLLISVSIIRIRLTLCLGAACWTGRGIILAWVNQTPLSGQHALSWLFAAQGLGGFGFVLFFGAFGSIAGPGSKKVLALLGALGSMLSILGAGVLAQNLATATTDPPSWLSNIPQQVDIAGMSWRLQGWSVLWLMSGLLPVLGIPLALFGRQQARDATPTGEPLEK